MRILLIAYEFPPSPSPQSLRWAYLARELARLGHEVHVLCPRQVGRGEGLPELPEQIDVHRTYAGPVTGLVAYLVERQARRRALARVRPATDRGNSSDASSDPSDTGYSRRAELNWKGRLFESLQRLTARMLFPDARGEWKWPAVKALARLIDEVRPDVVVSSHEPATSLEVGLHAKRRGFPWIVDLGDPVLADYTPPRWRRRARRLEARVCRLADHITVTTEESRDLLVARHSLDRSRISTLTQGFDDASDLQPSETEKGLFDPCLLELLYTGSFYRFRRSSDLLKAVLAIDGVRLSIASVRVPDEVAAWSNEHPDKVRVLGFLPHQSTLRLQRAADVLVNLANENPCQVPGKIYEYLGAKTPILHLGHPGKTDAAAQLVLATGHGWARENSADAIEELLAELVDRKRRGEPLCGKQAPAGTIAQYSWSRLGARFSDIAAAVASGARSNERTDPSGSGVVSNG